MSLISPAPAPKSGLILNSGFFPDIDPNDVRSVMRIDGTVTEQRLRQMLVEATISVNAELATWRQEQQTAGYSTLDAVPAEQVDVESTLLAKYRRAVYCTTAADLAERYRNFDSTKSGHKSAEEMEPSIDDLRRDARWALSDLLGIGRSTIELI